LEENLEVANTGGAEIDEATGIFPATIQTDHFAEQFHYQAIT